MNEGDLGHKAEEIFKEAALSEAKRRRQKYYFTGLCWNCSETINEGAFCDTDCRDDHQQRERFKK